MISPVLLFAGLLGCGPKTPPASAAVTLTRETPPPPLAPRSFELPPVSEATLANGLRVVVVENHETPLVYVSLTFQAGAWTDPADRPGLAETAMDMLNEGAGDLDAAGISAALRKLASNLNTGAGNDAAWVGISALKRNLAPTLDLMKLVLSQPTFPASEWQITQKRLLANLKQERDDPQQIARRVSYSLTFGGDYLGHLRTEASLNAMTPEDLRAWTSTWLRPERALLLVGGDTTLAEVKPLLEARFGDWKATTAAPTASPPAADVVQVQEKTTIYLVDKPGATQSVLRVAGPVGKRGDPDEAAFTAANAAVGGLFSARINLNLREDKGWTYGARSFVVDSYAPGIWTLGTSVRADVTVDAVKEVMVELETSQADRPITADELDAAKGYLLGTWPLDFETPDGLLGGLSDIWRYGLAEDWLSGYPTRLRAVDPDAANAAWRAHLDPSKLSFVVVGDAASLREPLAGLGWPMVELDRDGQPTKVNGP